MQDPRPVIAHTRRSARAPSRAPARANARGIKFPPTLSQTGSAPHLRLPGGDCLMKKLVLLVLIACAAASNAGAVQGDSKVYARDGARFALEGRLADAARAFEQAVALDPENGNAFYGLGNVYAEMGRWPDAVNAYYRAVSLNRDDVEALNNLGVALAMRGQNVQASA